MSIYIGMLLALLYVVGAVSAFIALAAIAGWTISYTQKYTAGGTYVENKRMHS